MLKRNQKIRCAEFPDGIETGFEKANYLRLFEPDAVGTRSYSPILEELEECDPDDLLEVLNLKN